MFQSFLQLREDPLVKLISEVNGKKLMDSEGCSNVYKAFSQEDLASGGGRITRKLQMNTLLSASTSGSIKAAVWKWDGPWFLDHVFPSVCDDSTFSQEERQSQGPFS